MKRRLLCITLLVSTFGAAPSPSPPSFPLEGLWGAERTFGPQARGLLTIDGRGTTWIASVAGFTARVDANGASIDFQLPSGQGSFRGRLNANHTRIDAIWTQPETVLSGDRYASPVTLRETQPRVWRGDLVPLIDRLTLYLVVAPSDTGTPRAYIRNPEENFGMRRWFSVALAGDKVTLANVNDAADVLSGNYDAEIGRASCRERV